MIFMLIIKNTKQSISMDGTPLQLFPNNHHKISIWIMVTKLRQMRSQWKLNKINQLCQFLRNFTMLELWSRNRKKRNREMVKVKVNQLYWVIITNWKVITNLEHLFKISSMNSMMAPSYNGQRMKMIILRETILSNFKKVSNH